MHNYSYDALKERASCAELDAAGWEKMAREVEENATRYRKYAKQRLEDAFYYRQLAERKAEEINKALEGIAA